MINAVLIVIVWAQQFFYDKRRLHLMQVHQFFYDEAVLVAVGAKPSTSIDKQPRAQQFHIINSINTFLIATVTSATDSAKTSTFGTFTYAGFFAAGINNPFIIIATVTPQYFDNQLDFKFRTSPFGTYIHKFTYVAHGPFCANKRTHLN